MKINWWVTALTVLIPISIIVLFCWYKIRCAPHSKPDIVVNDVTDLEDQLDTGDLVLVRYDSKYGWIIKLFTGTEWSHTAMVYRKPDGVYLVEVSNYTSHGAPEHDGLCVIPLDQWLELNDGRTCIYSRCKSMRPNPTDIEKILKKYKDIDLDMDLVNWSNTLFIKEYQGEQPIKPKYFCSEFIALMLQDLNVIDRDYTPESYVPEYLNSNSNYSPHSTFYIDVE